MHTTGIRIARIVGTELGIVAIKHPCSQARACLALVTGRTRIAVVTVGLVEDMLAARNRIASVIGADITIIAVKIPRSQAGTVTANVAGGTHVTVAARVRVGVVQAACDRLTGVVSTQVAVIAVYRGPGKAGPGLARVPRGTGVGIITWQGVVVVHAAVCRVTPIGSADVGIITVHRTLVRASPKLTMVPFRACVAVVAGCQNGIVDTHSGFAFIFGADVPVVAIEQRSGNANSVQAVVIEGTWIAVVAGPLTVFVSTAAIRLTEVGRTWVAVVTVQLAVADALACIAMIADCATVIVSTVRQVVFVGASHRGIAGIIRARVSVIAEQGLSRDTFGPTA